MKKTLLLLALILSSFICIGQENSTFVKKYISMVSTKNGVLQPWEKTDITVVFNSDKLKDIVFYYPSGNTLTFHQIGGVEEGVTEDGKEYQLVHCIDEDGVKVRMQLFSHDSCLRILIAKGYMVEFYKD
jgi:hypothetical protein